MENIEHHDPRPSTLCNRCGAPCAPEDATFDAETDETICMECCAQRGGEDGQN